MFLCGVVPLKGQGLYMLENDIKTLLEKVELLTELVNELVNQTVPCEKSSVSNRHVLTDVEGAMRITGKAKPTIYANARKGIIPSYNRGHKLYFYEDELYNWIEGGKRDCYGVNSEAMLNEIRQQVRHLPSSNR